MFTIVDFEDAEDGETNLPAIPIVLDDPKARMIKNRTKAKEPGFQLNLFAQLVGGQMEIQANEDTAQTYITERAKIAQEVEEKKA